MGSTMWLQESARRIYSVMSRAAKRVGIHQTPVGRRVLNSRPVMLFRRALMRPGPPIVSIHGHHMAVVWDENVRMSGLLIGQYEEETTRLLTELLAPGMTAVDVGAHIGYYTLLAARQLGPEGRVYAFEPEPSNYELLLRNIQLNRYSNVVAIRKAVSNSTGTLDLFIGEGSGLHSLYKGCHSTADKVKVEVTTLDGFFEEKGWPPVHVVKIDIEGAEKSAVEGMRELSSRNPQMKLIIEFGVNTLEAAGVTPVEFFDAIQGLRFTRIAVVSKQLEPLEIAKGISLMVRREGDRPINLICMK